MHLEPEGPRTGERNGTIQILTNIDEKNVGMLTSYVCF